MSEIKDFVFGKKAVVEAKAIGSFKVNGDEYFVRAMKGVALMYLINKMKNGRSTDAKVSAFLEFADSALLPESAAKLEALILEQDNEVEFEAPELIEILTHIMTIAAAGEQETEAPKPKPPTVRKRNA